MALTARAQRKLGRLTPVYCSWQALCSHSAPFSVSSCGGHVSLGNTGIRKRAQEGPETASLHPLHPRMGVASWAPLGLFTQQAVYKERPGTQGHGRAEKLQSGSGEDSCNTGPATAAAHLTESSGP